MRLRTLSHVLFVLLAPALLASSTRADVVVEPRSRVRAGGLVLTMVAVTPSRGLPAEDAALVEAAVRRHLASRRRALVSCVGGADLREDPLRQRVRRIEIHARFERSARPSRVWVQRDEGMPAAARSCLLEAARGVAVRQAPRGELVVRLVYELR